MTREPIYAELFARLSAAAQFKTASRRLKHWADTPSSEQPAMFMSQKTENVQTTPGLQPVHILEVDVYLYANTAGDTAKCPGEILNPLVDAIEATLAPDVVTNKCRLGGLVEHAWIEGSIETDEGTLGDQAVAIIPIIIKVP